MAIFTNVPDTNLEPGDPIRSVDIIAIKENTVYNREHTILDILNSQTFTSSGTWTRPGGFDATDSVIAVIVGGGGSGHGSRDIFSLTNTATGGGGGGVLCVSIPYTSVGSTVTVTVGAGGAGVTINQQQQFTDGNAGGDSSFGSYTATGGKGGTISVGGFGGGPKLISNSTSSEASANGARGNASIIDNGFTGGGGFSNTFNVAELNRTGGTSLFFGSGGNGSQYNANNATAGTAPGGGGGGTAMGNNTGTSAAGARGEVRVYVVRGKVPANAFLGSTTVSVAY